MMPHPSKRKGTRFEREIVQAARDAGLRAERAWGSNGQSLRTDKGKRCRSNTDILIEGAIKVQAKRRKRIARRAFRFGRSSFHEEARGGASKDRLCLPAVRFAAGAMGRPVS